MTIQEREVRVLNTTKIDYDINKTKIDFIFNNSNFKHIAFILLHHMEAPFT